LGTRVRLSRRLNPEVFPAGLGSTPMQGTVGQVNPEEEVTLTRPLVVYTVRQNGPSPFRHVNAELYPLASPTVPPVSA